MKYKIKHETYLFLIVPIIALLFFFCYVILFKDVHSWIVKIDAIIFCLSILLFTIEQIWGTYIIIDDTSVSIQRLLKRQKLSYAEINGINIEPYERYRRKPTPHTDYRIRMSINLITGKIIKLTDDASLLNGTSGFVTGTRERRPDEEVPIYKAYMQIKPKLKKVYSSGF